MNMDDDIITMTNPGANATKVLYDESANGVKPQPVQRDKRRVIVNVYANQIVTVTHTVILPGGTTPRAVNGAGDATTSSTLFSKDYVMQAGQNILSIVTTTGPTTFECGGRLVTERASTT